MRMRIVLAAILAIAPVWSAEGATTAMSDNALLPPSTLPYQMPPFDRIRETDYAPAFEAGMREQLREVAAIVHDPRPPDFQNTIVALDRSGQLLHRVGWIFDERNSNSSSPQMEAIDTEFAPKRSAHQDAIYLDHALWQRVEAVYAKRASLKLDPESSQLL
jgi:peptidyl-dipeptidase Dcp